MNIAVSCWKSELKSRDLDKDVFEAGADFIKNSCPVPVSQPGLIALFQNAEYLLKNIGTLVCNFFCLRILALKVFARKNILLKNIGTISGL